MITTLPDLTGLRYDHIEQYYLNFNPEIRLRRRNDDYFMTLKSENALVREEYEMPVSKNMFNLLEKSTITRKIIKKRYYMGDFEIDIFESPFSYQIVEVEFDSLSSAQSFEAPSWFGRDLTNDNVFHDMNERILRQNISIYRDIVREKPVKVIFENGYHRCECGQSLEEYNHNNSLNKTWCWGYCPECGKKLDWGNKKC
jgi:adenylate cyclase